MDTFDPTEHPHRRYNALTGDWVLVSPRRTKRPWQGQMVGYEMLGEPQRDLTAEQAAGRLRQVSEVHYNAR